MQMKCYYKNRSTINEPAVVENYKIRNEIHQRLMEKFSKVEKTYFSKLNHDLYSDVEKMIGHSYNKWRDNCHLNNNILYAGVLLLGVNTSDHTTTFSNLEESLSNSSFCKVVRINSTDCKTIKKFMEVLVNNIIPTETMKTLNISNSLKYSIHSLSTYAHKDKEVSREQIVVIIEDVESFNAQLLQNIIDVISTILPLLPFALLMGISSNMEILNEMLTIRSLSRISIQIFRRPNPASLLNNFILQLIEADLPFQLSDKVYDYVVNHMFLCLDYSIDNLISRYKYCILEHVMHNDTALAMLADNGEHSENGNLKEHTAHTRLSYILIHWLLDLFSKLEARKLGSLFYQLFGTQLNQGIGNSDDFKITLDIFRSLTPSEAVESIRRANSKLTADKENHAILEDLIETSEKYAEEILDGKFAKKAPSAPSNRLERKPSVRGNYQKELLKSIEAEKLVKEATPLENFAKWLQSWFAKNLMHYTAMQGYEGVYFDDLDQFKENLNPSIKRVIEWALINPHRYVKNENLRITDPSTVSPHMPDTCIIFKLHLEIPRLVNLYDLLEAFSAVIGEDISKKPPSLKTQCRFMQSVSELQFLGFVKGSNKSKADHVNKLSWIGIF